MVIMGLSVLLLSAYLAYLNLTLTLAGGLKVLKKSQPEDSESDSSNKERFTILIAHFNDSEKIPALLESLARQNYPGALRLCVVDDHSAEAHLISLSLSLKESSFDTLLIENELAPGKKNALEYAINRLGECFIIQLDADVVVEEGFLAKFAASKKQGQADILLGLVKMQFSKGFVSRFAAFEFLSLQMSGMALAAINRPIMANGAAMAYSSTTWLRFRTIGREWASGDDSFLVQAAKNAGDLKIIAVPAAAVSTEAPKKFNDFLNQRVRWGAKSVAYPSFFAKTVAFRVAFLNLSLVLTLFWALLFRWQSLPMVAFFFFLKGLSDFPLLRNFAKMTGQVNLLKGYWLAALFYPFYISLSVLFIIIPFKKRWKGRTYN